MYNLYVGTSETRVLMCLVCELIFLVFLFSLFTWENDAFAPGQQPWASNWAVWWCSFTTLSNYDFTQDLYFCVKNPPKDPTLKPPQGLWVRFQKSISLVHFILRSFYYFLTIHWWYKKMIKKENNPNWSNGFFCRSIGLQVGLYKPFFQIFTTWPKHFQTKWMSCF